MDFRPAYLKPLTKSYGLENIATMDIETERWLEYQELKDIPIEELIKRWHDHPLPPFLTCFHNPRTKEELSFDGKHAMRDFLRYYLTHKNRNLITYAHNGGSFDFTALHETLVKEKEFNKFTPQLIYVNGGIMIMRIKDEDKHVWQFRDSMYLLKKGLDKLCESFNPETKKLKMPPYPYEEHKEQWRKYCMNDCISLAQILEIFNNIIINEIQGSIGLTASSTALRTWRRRFQKYPIPTYFTWNNFIRQGYYGGRCEVFNMYAPHTAYLYDVKSMYPSVMVDNIFPVSKPKRVKMRDPWDCAGKCGFMECTVESPPLYIPLLPYRHETSNKLLFPLGKWTAVYEFSLIEKALELGYKIKPHRVIEFEGDYIFGDYINTIYPYKQNNTGALEEIAKLLMNGLYGKTGEHSEREILITAPEADILGTFPIPHNPMGYTTQTINRYSAHHLPAIASRVTALAQLKLYKAFEQILRKKGAIYYCDTDSVVTDVKIPDGSNLGQWELKHEMSRGVFFAPKAYCYEHTKGSIKKLKGFSHKFSKTLKFEAFMKALPPTNNFSAFKETSIHPSSFKEISVRDLCGFSTVVKTREIKKEYDKRTVIENYDTEPLYVLQNEVMKAPQRLQ